MLKKILIPLVTIVVLFSCLKKSEGLKQSDLHPLMKRYLSMHLKYQILNDKISQRILSNYINIYDYGKYYFYKSDIDSFMVHKDKLDDYIIQSQYNLLFTIVETYKKRFNENMKIVDKLIEKKYTFKSNETMTTDRNKVGYAKNKSEMKDRWRKLIKLQLLNYTSSGKSQKDARKKLKKKYFLMKKRIEKMNQEQVYSNLMKAFSNAMDPHTSYLTQEEHEDFQIAMRLKLEGIGVRLSTEDGFVKVESIIPGGATDKLSEKIKLKHNDKIVAVAQKNGEFIDVIDMDLRDVVKLIRGKKGTEVRLKILRYSGESNKPTRMIVPIVREEIKLKDSEAKSQIHIQKSGGKTYKIGYIVLKSFYSDSNVNGKLASLDVKKQINLLMNKGAQAIVLDLRYNPGGGLTEAIKITGLFIDSGPVLQIKGNLKRLQVIDDNDAGQFYSGPLVVLINKMSASASEILAGAIKDYKRGIIIGPTNTFGKGTVQSYRPQRNEKGAIKVTTHIFYQPDGTSNQLHGIAPDIIVPSINSIWDIGEHKTKYPLQWKKIQRANFTKTNWVNDKILRKLKAQSKRRIYSNVKYQKLIKKIKKYRTQLRKKTISLKEESKFQKQQKKEIRKSIRENNKKLINLKKDLLLKEAFLITKDYVNILRRMKKIK